MADRNGKKGIDYPKLMSQLEKKVQEIANGADGFGVVTLEVVIRNREPKTTRLGGVQTENI